MLSSAPPPGHAGQGTSFVTSSATCAPNVCQQPILGGEPLLTVGGKRGNVALPSQMSFPKSINISYKTQTSGTETTCSSHVHVHTPGSPAFL